MRLRSPRILTGIAFGILVVAVAGLILLSHAPPHRLVVDGQVLGSVHDPQIVDTVVTMLAEAEARETGLRMAAVEEISFEEKSLGSRLRAMGRALDEQEVETLLTEHVTFLARGIEIRVNGQPLVVVRDAETGRAVLEDLERRYLASLEAASENIQVHAVRRVDTVDFRETELAAVDVSDVDEAVQILEGEHEAQIVHRVQSGENLWTIASSHQVSVGDLQAANPQLQNFNLLRPGDMLSLTVPRAAITFETEETITVIEEIPFATEVVQDSSLWNWQRITRRHGQPGERRVTYDIVRQANEIVDRVELEAEVLKEPVTHIIAQGTRAQQVLRHGQLLRPAQGFFSSYYGPRWGGFHAGVDIANNTGTPIVAAESGRVETVGWRGGYGLMVIINHGAGVTTLYAHLSQTNVNSGQQVARGQQIGRMGATGSATGPHLHFEVRLDGVPTNPLPFLR